MTEPAHFYTPYLVEQLDAFQGLIDERDQLRDQIADACLWLGDDTCTCREYLSATGEPEVDDCTRCIALSILRGPS